MIASRIQPKTNDERFNPLSHKSDKYCDKIFAAIGDGQGGFLEKVQRLCELLDIDTADLAHK